MGTRLVSRIAASLALAIGLPWSSLHAQVRVLPRLNTPRSSIPAANSAAISIPLTPAVSIVAGFEAPGLSLPDGALTSAAAPEIQGRSLPDLVPATPDMSPLIPALANLRPDSEDKGKPSHDERQGSFWSLEHLNGLFDGSSIRRLIGPKEHDREEDASSTGPQARQEPQASLGDRSGHASEPGPDQESAHGRPAAKPVRPTHPGFIPHETEPVAVLPDGTALPPDSYMGGFHGTRVSPDTIVKEHGFRPETLFEDWRLLEHAQEQSSLHSAFRGATPFVSTPQDSPFAGAAEWADEGGWVYDIHGVPTWDVNSALDGRVPTPDGRFRGNLMYGEVEQAVPSQIPLECIKRWGQVETLQGRNYVREWTPNPRYNDILCARFFAMHGAGQR